MSLHDFLTTAGEHVPAALKEAVRTGATRVGTKLGRVPGCELLTSHLAELFAQLDINCVLDVGAHRGQYGRFLRNLGYRGRIVSIEPIAANVAYIEQRRAGDDDWWVRPYALGRESGTRALNVAQVSQFSSFLAPNDFSRREYGEASAVVRTDSVVVHRLAEVFDDCTRGIAEPRVFLKMDTQGYEMEVLAGAGPSLGRVSALQCEVSVQPLYTNAVSYLQAIAQMAAYGFDVTGLYPVNRSRDMVVIEFDCVMRRRAGVPAPTAGYASPAAPPNVSPAGSR